jgi:hypothetical protein
VDEISYAHNTGGNSSMPELVEPEVSARIHARANRKCECENPRCKHVATLCCNGLNGKSGISLPEGVKTAEEQFEKGRAVCQECFQRSDSFYRQQPFVS